MALPLRPLKCLGSKEPLGWLHRLCWCPAQWFFSCGSVAPDVRPMEFRVLWRNKSIYSIVTAATNCL